MEAFRAIASRVSTPAGHSPSRILRNAAHAMYAATTYGIDCGGPFPHDFCIVVAATAPSALAETPTPPATTSPLFLPAASRKLATADGIFARAPFSSPSSSTAVDLSPAWARRPPAVSFPTGACMFGSNKVLTCSSSYLAHQFYFPPSTMSRCASYSTASGDADDTQCAEAKASEETPVIYFIGMFDDINEPKWAPDEFAAAHVPLQSVELVGDQKYKKHTVLTELAKDWFVSLPMLIEKLKRHGYSFYKPVTVSQLMVDKYGHFVISDGTHLRKTNKSYVSKDYFSSADVFEGIIRRSCGDVVLPDSFKDLLEKLRMKRTPHGYYFCVHPTFLLLPAFSQAYLDVYDYVKENLSDEIGKKNWLSLQSTTDLWDEIMEGNVLLVAWVEEPYKRKHDPGEEGYIIGHPKHLFRYLRNVHSHLLGHLKLLGKTFTKNEARLLVDCKFSDVMPTLYWKLWNSKILTDIESESYFCKPGGTCCPTPGSCLRRDLRLCLAVMIPLALRPLPQRCRPWINLFRGLDFTCLSTVPLRVPGPASEGTSGFYSRRAKGD